LTRAIHGPRPSGAPLARPNRLSCRIVGPGIHEGFRLGRGLFVWFHSAPFESRVHRQGGDQMLACSLELVTDESQVEQEDPEVVPGALRVEGPLAA
jgi:hypothetical protein